MKAEEPPSALLLGHAASLSARKQSRRRASVWYLYAADRLEKAGIVSFKVINPGVQADNDSETLSPPFLPSSTSALPGTSGQGTVTSVLG